MNRRRLHKRTLLLLVVESCLIYSALLAAIYLRLGSNEADYQLTLNYGYIKAAFTTLLCIAAFYLYDLYDFALMHDRRELGLRLLQSLGLAWIALAVLMMIAPEMFVGRGVALISLPLTLVLMLVWRGSVHWLMGHPNVGERVLIVGSGDAAVDIARQVLARPDAGLRIVGFVDNRPELVGKSLVNPRVIGLTADLPTITRRERIDRIVVAMGDRRGQFPTNQLLDLCLSGEVAIEESASFYERVTGRVQLETLRPSWLIFSGRKRQRRLGAIAGIIFNRGAAVIGAILSSPIALLTIILIKLESKGPVLYRQERVGQNGRPFEVYKFRSMRTDAEADGPVWARTADDRVTRVGKVIRKIRVDEIPQFWNILRGDMNFVGPRPERPHFVKQLADEIPFYEQRHLVAPGLTGWAQIKYPYGASVEDARQKLQYDLYYIKNQSLVLDATIMFETIKTILFSRGAR